jgi:hypothetical protein
VPGQIKMKAEHDHQDRNQEADPRHLSDDRRSRERLLAPHRVHVDRHLDQANDLALNGLAQLELADLWRFPTMTTQNSGAYSMSALLTSLVKVGGVTALDHRDITYSTKLLSLGSGQIFAVITLVKSTSP